MREALEQILRKSRMLLADADWDVARLQCWNVEREKTFARLRASELSLDEGERDTARALIEEILQTDAQIISRLQERCCELSRELHATERLRRRYPDADSSIRPLLRRAI